MICIKEFNEYDGYKSIFESIYRPYSNKFYEQLRSIRESYDRDDILDFDDLDLFEETDLGKFELIEGNLIPLDLPMVYEAEYKGKEVKLNSPMRSSGPKKYKVYVKNPKTGKVKVVHFGDLKGGLTSKVNDPEARISFAKRHDCSNKKDKTKPGYWSCRLPRFKNLVSTDFSGYW